ncbi:MAG: heavy metal translocating P-type ATPase [Acidobacteria bacterium]|nr:heavy metal translocating P-type ATPase [Acidobacteriota bacterium]
MSTPKRSFKIHGMDCAEEIAVLKREVGPLVGGEANLAFDLLNGKMILSEGAPASSEAVLQAVRATGMQGEPWVEETQRDRQGRPLAIQARTALTVISAILILLGLASHALGGAGVLGALGWKEVEGAHSIPVMTRIFYGAASLAAAWFILPKAWFSARRLRPDMNLLMTIAVLGAIGIGEWLEAATVASLFAVSLVLEAWSLGRARRAVQSLLKLAPDTVHVLTTGGSGETQDLPPAQVTVGAHFQIRPGERVPLDGQVVDGEGEINEAAITGESLPVAKAPGAALYAGSINGNTTLVGVSTHPASDTVLARIIRMVGEAQHRRAPAEQWVDRFARIYTPVVMVLAILVALLPPLLGLGPWSTWFYRALVLLVIACPCALVISTPVSIVSGLASAARHGVLIKGGAFLEAPAHLKAIAFDKTGTLTRGTLEVATVIPLVALSKSGVLKLAASLEAQTDHPVARAILAHAKAQGITLDIVRDFEIIPGKGARGLVGERAAWVGSPRWGTEQGSDSTTLNEQIRQASETGATVILVGDATGVLGLISLADEVRSEGAEILAKLRQVGLQHLVMLTGDHAGAAHRVAKALGLEEVQADLLPEQKVQAVEALVKTYGCVAMVGDGVNDAPAMAHATIGIAMGTAGSDTAIETADIALMSDDLTRLPWLISHAQKTLRIIRQNITFSLSVKAVFILLTLAGHASLWAAIAADMGASLLVVFNGLRMLNSKA